VNSSVELLSAMLRRGPTVAFVDSVLLPQLAGATTSVPIVGIIDETRADAVRTLHTDPWLSHLVTASMLSSPAGRVYLATALERVRYGPESQVLGATGIGRAALLAHSRRREHRFERMREFFAAHGVSNRTIAAISDVAEELVTNALYDAPHEAGTFKHAVERTRDVELPPDKACEISYGIEHGSAFVRVRDPFGALTRRRLIHVLERCSAASGVHLDESRGGAGLGLWRVFSVASTIAVAVIPGTLTDILVRVDATGGRVRPLRAIHLFLPQDNAIGVVAGRFAADHDDDLLDESFTAFHVA